jgi:hypothetical protein
MIFQNLPPYFGEKSKVDHLIAYHDIVGDSFNVDHVVISAKGIYVIETKTYSKPASGAANITYDGQQLLVNGTIRGKCGYQSRRPLGSFWIGRP